MRIYQSRTWINDLDEEIAALAEELYLLEGKTICVTGATGLICSALIDLLIRYNETHFSKINMIVAGRSLERMRERFFPYFQRDYLQFYYFDASLNSQEVSISCDYIVHGAGNASPDKMVKEPIETMTSNFYGLKRLLDCAKEHAARRVLFISSSEGYGKKEGNEPYREDEYGYIDLLNVRSAYPVGKRAAETLCTSYVVECSVDAVIVRPGHIYGPTAAADDNRVSSAWAFAPAGGKDIVMGSDGTQIRSYCYCLDCAAAILKVLIKGRKGEAYNISNPDSVICIKEMAKLLANAAGVKLLSYQPSDEEKKRFNPMNNSSLDASKLLALGWKGLFPAERGFIHTIRIIRESDPRKATAVHERDTSEE